MILAPAGKRGRWNRTSTSLARALGALDPADEREFGAALDQALSHALPALGLVFGLGVVLFSAWDYWIAPERAGVTSMVRLSLVLAGAIGYVEWTPRIPVAWRCVLVYGTHSGAMIFSSALLPHGLVLALPAITGAMFPLALVEPRPHRLLAIILVPSLMLALFGAEVLPRQIYAGSMFVYLLSIGLLLAVALSQGRVKRATFLAERALAYAAHHDSLSGVLARGYLFELAGHDIALAKRYGHPLSIAMIDIDHFKGVNDTYGHAAGDALLCAVSRACSRQLRSSDYLGRIGGEEFVCVMPETAQDDAMACAERMRAAVGAIRLDTPAGLVRCTISIGVAPLRAGHADVGMLVADADAAMYRAKSKGRDRVELAVSHSGDAAAE